MYVLIISGFFNGGIVTSELINWYKSIGDLEELTRASFLTLSNLIAVKKFYILFRYKTKIMKLVEALKCEEFRTKNSEQIGILLKYIKLSKSMTKTILCLCVLTCFFWTIYPFTVEGEYILPIAAWMPFNTSRSPNFEIAFVYESVATVIGGITDLNTDCFIAGKSSFSKYENQDSIIIGA